MRGLFAKRAFGSGKIIGAFFGALALVVQPLVPLNIPSAFAASLAPSAATHTVDTNTTDVSTVNATGYENLVYSFTYDATGLDNGDVFTYGWRVSGGADQPLGTVNGANAGSAGAALENGTHGPLALPASANDKSLEFYFKNVSNNGSDIVQITNITLNGDAIAPPAPVCTYDFQAQKMWEITWGHGFADRNGGLPTFTMQSNGGLTSLNGGPVPAYMTPSWQWLYVTDNGNYNPRHIDYGFADGTVRTADITWSEVSGCHIPEIVWGFGVSTLDPFPSTNAANKANGHQYVEEVSDTLGTVTLRFVNPTAQAQYFEIRKDDAASTSTNKFGPCRIGVTPLSGACNGKRYLAANDFSYPSQMVAPNNSVEVTYTVTDNVAVRVTFGPERNWDFDWTVFQVNQDAVAPAVPTHVSPADGAVRTTADQDKMDWSDESDPSGVSYRYQSSTSSATNPDGSFVSPAYTSGTLAASEIPTPNTPAGEYYWHVKACDGNGNCSAWSNPWKVTIDNLAPILNILQPVSGTTVNGYSSYVYRVEASDNVELDKVDIQLRNGNGGNPNGFAPRQMTRVGTSDIWEVVLDSDVEDLANGSYLLRARAYDKAGTVAFDAESGVIVNNTPEAPEDLRWAIGSNAVACGGTTNNNTTAPTWGAVNGAVSYRYSYMSPSDNTWQQDSTVYASPTTGPISFGSSAGDDGVWRFRVTAVAQNGSESVPSAACSITYDGTDPELTVTKPPVRNEDGTVSFTGTLDEAGVVTITLDGVSTTLPPLSGAGTWVYTSPVLAPGTHNFDFSAEDEAGNASNTDSYEQVVSVVTPPITPIPGSGGSSTPSITLSVARPISPLAGASTASVVSFTQANPTDASDDDSDAEVLGTNTENSPESTVAAVAPSADGWKFWGIAWYWILLALALLAALWAAFAAWRRRQDQDIEL